MGLKVTQVRYMIHFNTELFPLYHHEITEGLPKIGYELVETWPKVSVMTSRVYGTGEVARKGKCSFFLSADTQQVGVIDDSIESAIKNFDEILKMFKEEYNITFNNYLKYYSYVGDYIYYTKKPAYETLSNKFTLSQIDVINNILKDKMSLYQINLGVSGLKVNSENWYDISITPGYERNNAFIIRIVMRNPKEENILKYMKESEEKIKTIIKFIEE